MFDGTKEHDGGRHDLSKKTISKPTSYKLAKWQKWHLDNLSYNIRDKKKRIRNEDPPGALVEIQKKSLIGKERKKLKKL